MGLERPRISTANAASPRRSVKMALLTELRRYGPPRKVIVPGPDLRAGRARELKLAGIAGCVQVFDNLSHGPAGRKAD